MARRFQFSLRLLLATTAVTSVVLAWLFLPLFELRRQRHIANDLHKRGMEIVYDHDALNNREPPPGPAWARRLYGNDLFVNPIAVAWHGAPPSDDDLRLLAELKHLRRLSLAGVAINDAYLNNLAQLKTLEELDLRATAITDRGLAQFPAFPNLKRVFLAKSNVSQEGIRKLRRRVGRVATLSVSW